MSFDNERDSVAGSKSLTVFRRVEFTDLTKLELLDEAIILKSESINPNSNAVSPNPVMSDETGLNSPDKTIERVKSRRQVAPSWIEDAGVMANGHNDACASDSDEHRPVCVDSGGPMGQCVTKPAACPTKVLPGPNS